MADLKQYESQKKQVEEQIGKIKKQQKLIDQSLENLKKQKKKV